MASCKEPLQAWRKGVRERGFSLMELMLVISLMLLLLAITAPRLSKTMERQTESKAAAMTLVEDLRFARQRAVATMTPVALVIPSDTLQSGHSRGYLLREGLTGQTLVRTVNFDRLYQSVSLFVGYWELDPAELQNSSLQNSSAPLSMATNSLGYDVGTWSSSSTDYHFLFTPQGTVVANGNMPHFDNCYHLALGQYFKSEGTGLLPGGLTGAGFLSRLFKMSSAWHPMYTVTITPAGEIELSPGLKAAAASVFSTASPADPGRGAPLPASSSTPQPLSITAVDLRPEINRLIYPAATGFDAAIAKDGFLRLTITARGSGASYLSLSPSASASTNAPSADAGTFSSADSVQAEYDPAAGEFRATAEWFPPGDAVHDAQYLITLTVTDGGTSAVQTRRVVIKRPGRIAFVSRRLYGVDTVCIMNEDGSDIRAVSKGSAAPGAGVPWRPTASADGSQLAYSQDLVVGADTNHQIFSVSPDGEILRQLDPVADPFHHMYPSISPDGARIAYTRAHCTGPMYFAKPWGPYNRIKIVQADGSGAHEITSTSTFHDNYPSWSPDGTRIVFESDRDGANEIYSMNADGTGITRLTNNAVSDGYPSWSPDGLKITFTRNTGTNPDVFVMNADGTGQQRLTTNAAWDLGSSFSADGRKIVFTSNRDGRFQIYVMEADGTNQQNISNDPAEERDPYWID